MRSVPRTDVTLEDVAPDLAAAQATFMAVAYPGAVDLVTRELLRILSGRLSHCRLCSNLRLRGNRPRLRRVDGRSSRGSGEQ